MTRNLFILCMVLTPLPLAAQTIYKCTDAGGSVLISNSRVNKNCQAIVSEEHAIIPAPRAPAARASANPTPAGFPRVEESAQKARDGDRRHILEQELASEQRNLDQARKGLAEQEAVRPVSPERTASYRERVGQFQRNVEAIQKELNNLR